MTAVDHAPAHQQRERGLSKAHIVDAALELLNEVGFTKLTVRTLAAKLNVQAAALYWHVKNKQALIDAMAFAIMTPRTFERPDNWRTLLLHIAHHNRRTLLGYRDGAQVIAHANLAAYDQAMEGLEAAFAYLVDDGFTPELAASSFFLVVRFTLGCVFEEQADPRADPEAREALIAARQAAGGKYPTLEAVFAAVHNGSREDAMERQFEHALNIILDGIQLHLDALPKVA